MPEQGSRYDQLFYPYLFEGEKVDRAEVIAQVRHSTLEKCHEVVALRHHMHASAGERIIAAGEAMARAFQAGATLFAFGNGGSATDAQDMVTELVNPPFAHWRPLPALALTNDVAVVTALGNDVGFPTIFTRQIIALGQPGDIALGVSTSGNSVNILQALEQAKKQGLLTIGLSGYDGGKLARSPEVDICITAPCDHIPRIQEAQATAYHAILEMVQALLDHPTS
ncbi:D-sedoheptulose-7-phosphate isomerase [Dictyobacter kobayashii]|uniref:Phosphoheptose isomerase n=1 Tax=Dictyobacter kobayashii TaxID=2014872 RepID=A0A402AYZ6_9CHLR|nr:SIS domain-containing protein [Dictyobacter kobayashii]GCE24308.1 phosphoheptose isomerase [Dictyobacter kobayashii]